MHFYSFKIGEFRLFEGEIFNLSNKNKHLKVFTN